MASLATASWADFEHGGRWYATWQNLEKKSRSQIRIDGRPTVELDFRCCHPQLLCATAGIDLPFGDPEFDFYRLPPFERSDIKAAVNTLLNAPSSRSARGALTRDLQRPGRPNIASALCHAIRAAWPELAPHWGTGVGLRLQRVDAGICTEVQAEMRSRRIPVLSIHDSFIVPAEFERDLQQVMDAAMEAACRRLREHPIEMSRPRKSLNELI
ncbi:hypothetical protein [Hyphomicrobium sp. CS1GBMeth3]|uniref:hypothetical protein n=1 Tax=Hyphomicrobium sp. CS1GBMeth3 TaxID=1892845 RepID=UPI0009314313|nr:hypothetical protein [Hyphomicrobium sp. CS1GBMeth3]